MNTIYIFVSGFFFKVSIVFFALGLLYRVFYIVYSLIKKETFIISYISPFFSLRSIVHWLIPFSPHTWRSNPLLTINTFSFHICVLLCPIFLLSHVVFLEDFINFDLAFFPNIISDFMSIIVIFNIIFFIIRRLTNKVVNFVTTSQDYLILLFIFILFSTGFIAHHQLLAHKFFLIVHIFFSEIFIILLPHTKIIHMLLFFVNRSYVGSEFGKVRKVKDW